MSPRKDEETRRAERISAAWEAKRREKRSSGVYAREDAAAVNFWLTKQTAAFTVAHDELDCPQCDVPTELTVAESATVVHKRWTCPNCKSTTSGRYRPYIIREEPYRP